MSYEYLLCVCAQACDVRYKKPMKYLSFNTVAGYIRCVKNEIPTQVNTANNIMFARY